MSLDDLLGIEPGSTASMDAREDVREYEHLIITLVTVRKSKMTQAEVAKILETTQSAVSKFERLGGDAHYSTIQRYARAIGGRVRSRFSFDNKDKIVSFSATPLSASSIYYRRKAA